MYLYVGSPWIQTVLPKNVMLKRIAVRTHSSVRLHVNLHSVVVCYSGLFTSKKVGSKKKYLIDSV